jgi:hypothetical protein
MFCHFCGARLEASASFCPSCGKAVGGGVPLMPVQGRIAGHVRLLGILWLALSAFQLFPAIFFMGILSGHVPSMWFPVPPLMFGLMRLIGMLSLAAGILGLIAGWGLIERQPWARMLAIVLGVLNLIHIPFGTLLGIYTLWVLLPAESEQEYRREVRAA